MGFVLKLVELTDSLNCVVNKFDQNKNKTKQNLQKKKEKSQGSGKDPPYHPEAKAL